MKEETRYKTGLRPQVIEEALRLFLERGIRAVKMDEIAHNLSISKRTLYELYSNKEDLLIECIMRQLEKRRAEINQLRDTTDDVMDLLTGVLGIQLRYAASTNSVFYKDLTRYPMAEQVLHSYYETEQESSREFLSQGVREGYFINNVDYDVFQKIAGNVMKMVRTSEEFSVLTYRDVFNSYIYLTIRGICTLRGIEKLDNFIKNV